VQKPAAQLSAAPAGEMAAPIPPIFATRPAPVAAQSAGETIAAPPRTTPPQAATGGNPMAFFKKGDDATPPQAPAQTAAPQQPAAPIEPVISTQQTASPVTRPLSWEEIMQAENAAKPEAALPSAPVKPSLDAETEKLLKQAGEATRKALLGKAQKDDDAK
jgi:hypothetical protein